MGSLVSLDRWVGKRGDPLEPEKINFTTKPAKSCHGCMFDDQHYEVCNRACDVADLAGMPLCEDGYVYVLRPVDPRQLSIEVKA